MSRIAVGVGCRKGCAAETILALVDQALSFLPSFPPPGLAESQPEDKLRRESTVGQRAGGEMDSRLRGNDDPNQIIGLFTLVDKMGESGLVEAASRLGLELTFLSRDALGAAADRIQTPSRRAEAEFGVPSVAEAAALVGAGPDAVLLVPRIADGGATCAIAGAAP